MITYSITFLAIGTILGSSLLFSILVVRRLRGAAAKIATNVVNAQGEVSAKRAILREVARVCLKTAVPEDIEKIRNETKELEELIRAERGKTTITEAEIEAVDRRLRDLDDIRTELEVSALEAAEELDRMKEQQRVFEEKSNNLKAQLSSTHEQLDMLLGELEMSQEATDKLEGAKRELIDSEKQIDHLQEQLKAINKAYIELKQAFDALDIEYAQLYERQNAQI